MTNIVLILTDQQHYRTMGCTGCPEARTPHLDALAQQGILFANHHVTNTVCMPSRASIFTGQYINQHGVWTNGCRLSEETPTITSMLNAAGYQTAHFGKLHLEPILNRVHAPCSYHFDSCEIGEGDQQLTHDDYFVWLRQNHPDLFLKYILECYQKGHAKGYTSCLPEECHLSTWTTNRSIDWLRNRRKQPADGSNQTNPFFLSVGFFDPHHAFNPPEPYASQFANAEVTPPRYHPDSLATRPPQYHTRHADISSFTQSPAMLDTIRAYHTMMAHVDHCIGRLCTELQALGLAEDTVILYSSDHGELLGNHGLLWKGPFMLDDLLHVPLIAAKADGTKRGVVAKGLSSGVDILATIAHITGATAPANAGTAMTDADLTPFPFGPRPFVLSEWESQTNVSSLRCIRSPDAKLVVKPDDPSYGEFYDYRTDPDEFFNRFDDPAAQATIICLQEQLATCYPSGRHPCPQECEV
ncbi:MAG: sulfatase-like hydrolase/transferase [Planctomycetota bacterium]|jgi:arylsulfatase A-like enzyme|nr:sulfatase-like hydrolase/transferase [Planctomycetota bacterium]